MVEVRGEQIQSRQTFIKELKTLAKELGSWKSKKEIKDFELKAVAYLQKKREEKKAKIEMEKIERELKSLGVGKEKIDVNLNVKSEGNVPVDVEIEEKRTKNTKVLESKKTRQTGKYRYYGNEFDLGSW